MAENLEGTRLQIARQVVHWTMASARLAELDNMAPPAAWARLERYLGTELRRHLTLAVDRLRRQADALYAATRVADSAADLERVRRQLVRFRGEYLRTETTLDFYTDAINTRTNPQIAMALQVCDVLTRRSMTDVLDQLGKRSPLVLTYIDKGLGASILKAGLRLWDGATENPAAAIKITWHNLYRPTSLLHEAGHQVAHITGWNEELAAGLERGLSGVPSDVAEIWASWASEIAGDAFAFVHTGYAAVAALHDVLAGEDLSAFRYRPGDPHPVSYVRVLLGTEMCRQFYGSGPWDQLADAWTATHDVEHAPARTRELLRVSQAELPRIVEICLRSPARAFGGRPLSALADPGRVSPNALMLLERQIGAALTSSPYWVWTECLRLLALTGYQIATSAQHAAEALKKQKEWMLRLGAALQAA